MTKYIALFLFGFFLISIPIKFAMADEIKFEASIDKKKIALGETAQLGLTFYGTQRMPAPDIGNIDGFDVRYLGPSTMMTVINGKVSSSVTHMYTVLPLRTGQFRLGQFSFAFNGNNYTSNEVTVEVVEERASPQQPQSEKPPAGEVVESLDIKDRLFITLRVDKVRAYVNELIPVTVKMYVNRLNISDIQLPTFMQEGFSKAQFTEPKQYTEQVGGIFYDVLEFKTTVFGTRPGEYRLGPAQLKCSLIVKKRVRKSPMGPDDLFGDEHFNDPFFEGFFTQYERFPTELKSQDVPLTLLPLPEEGKPADFSGAIGDYQFIFHTGPKKVKAGDPVTVRMEINGKGNFNTVIIPKLENTDGFRVYEPQIKTEANSKTFTQVVIPDSEQITQTPKAAFSYFDPDKREYKTIVQGPLPLEVEKVTEAPAQVVGMPAPIASLPTPGFGGETEKKEEPQRDILYIKDSTGVLRPKESAFYKNKLLLIGLLLPLIALFALSIVYARKDRLARDVQYARRSIAFQQVRREFKALKHLVKQSDPKVFYETLFTVLQNYLGGKLGLPAAGITFDAVERILESKGIDRLMIGKIRNLFEVCDRTRFAFSAVDGLRMRDDLRELEEIMRYFERLRI